MTKPCKPLNRLPADFSPKPYTGEQLLGTVRKALDGGCAHRVPAEAFRGLSTALIVSFFSHDFKAIGNLFGSPTPPRTVDFGRLDLAPP